MLRRRRHVGVHAVERRRLGGAQTGAAILQLIPGEGNDNAVPIDRGRQGCHPVGRRRGGDEVLEPALDPFDRPPGLCAPPKPAIRYKAMGLLGDDKSIGNPAS
jgi:hypothetical protein